jgi:hypothetical protein
MTTTLKKQSSWFNPYFLNGKQIDKIKVFNPDTEEVLFSFNWFGSNNNYPELILPLEVKNRKKLNLKDNKAGQLIVVVGKENLSKEKRYYLYIPSNLLEYKSEGQIKRYDNGYTSQVYDKYTIKVQASENNGDKVEPVSERIFTVEEYIRTEKSSKGVKAEELYKEMQKLHIDIKLYDLQKILDNYKLERI